MQNEALPDDDVDVVDAVSNDGAKSTAKGKARKPKKGDFVEDGKKFIEN